MLQIFVFREVKLLLLILILVLIFNQAIAQTKFAVIGCYGDNSSSEGMVADLINSWADVEFIVTAGDNYYDGEDADYDSSWNSIDTDVGQYYHQWIGNYLGDYGSGSEVNKFFPAMGNHEWYHIDSCKVYTDYFTLPGSGFSNTSGNERYYDFVWDNIHFFMLSNYGVDVEEYSSWPRHGNYGEPDGVSSSSVQANWFFNQLDNCVANHLHWRVVIGHYPPYKGDKDDPTARWDYKAHGAHVVISAHDHFYQVLEVDDFPYIINGAGGGTLRNTANTENDVFYAKTYGAMLVEALTNDMVIKFYRATDGQLLHTYNIHSNEAIPVELTFFTGNINGNKVELRWRTETEVNNYGFNIERAIDNNHDLSSIVFIKGNGNSNTPKYYEYIDYDIVKTGKYYYRLKQIDIDGQYDYSNVVSVEVDRPNIYYLGQNYPNPFNPATSINFSLPEKQMVMLKIYNTVGELVRVLVNEIKEPGSHWVTFSASEFPNGMYFYQLHAGSFIETKKMVLIK